MCASFSLCDDLRTITRSGQNRSNLPYTDFSSNEPIMFHIYQTQPDGTAELLYETPDEHVAEVEVDRINSHLSERGIPSWVSCAYYN